MNVFELPAYGGPRDGGFIRAEVIPKPGQAMRVEGRYRYRWNSHQMRFEFVEVVSQSQARKTSE